MRLGGPIRLASVVALATLLTACGADEQTETTEVASEQASPALETELTERAAWAGYPFESRFIEVNGSKLHYVDEGKRDGDVFLLLHGNPTSSYLWRNVIPHLTDHGRVIAVDNIGFGRSDKPDIGYTFAEHATYIEGFVEALDLNNIVLVVHDWGSALGFDYASHHPERIKGLAFMESFIPGTEQTRLADMPPETAKFFGAMRTPGVGEEMVIDQNIFIEQALFEGGMIRTLSEEEKAAYREPFMDKAARKPILVWPRQVPIDGEPADVVARVEAFGAWLIASEKPKLMLYADPGGFGSAAVAERIANLLPNTETIAVGPGLHFMQEDQPDAIGVGIADWYVRTYGANSP